MPVIVSARTVSVLTASGYSSSVRSAVNCAAPDVRASRAMERKRAEVGLVLSDCPEIVRGAGGHGEQRRITRTAAGHAAPGLAVPVLEDAPHRRVHEADGPGVSGRDVLDPVQIDGR